MTNQSNDSTISFQSDAHLQRFTQAMVQQGKIYDGKLDQEYSAAFFILSADDGMWQAAQRYISRYGIDFEEMITKTYLSTGEAALIRLAGNLFGQDISASPVDLMYLDPRNFQLALHALILRRYSFRLEDL